MRAEIDGEILFMMLTNEEIPYMRVKYVSFHCHNYAMYSPTLYAWREYII